MSVDATCLSPSPPPSNTGVTIGGPLPGVAFVHDDAGQVLTRFDYYRASVDVSVDRVVDVVRRAVGVDCVSRRGLFSYERGVSFVLDDLEVASVFYSAGRAPLAQASGVFAQKLYDQLLPLGLDRLSLARADVSLDSSSGDFELIDSVVREVALARNVETTLRGDWDTPGSPAGRTRYVGSRQSFRFRRLYEFAKWHGYGAAWRYELEVKPTSDFKLLYGAMNPMEILRADDFSRRVLNRLGVDLSRMVVRVDERERVADPFANLASQYWRVLASACEARGGDLAALGRDLMLAVDAVRAERGQ